uniref:Uncharacterized protein n=1 Tax=Cacopsylla melanoneura TaxID=428564 RepID=A0A8D8TDX8_9HEMI
MTANDLYSLLNEVMNDDPENISPSYTILMTRPPDRTNATSIETTAISPIEVVSVLDLSTTKNDRKISIKSMFKPQIPLNLCKSPLDLSIYRPRLYDVSPTREMSTQTEMITYNEPNAPATNQPLESNPLLCHETPSPVTMYSLHPDLELNISPAILPEDKPTSPRTDNLTAERPFIRSPPQYLEGSQISCSPEIVPALTSTSDNVTLTIERVATCTSIVPTFRPTQDRSIQHKKHVKDLPRDEGPIKHT